MNSHYPPLDVVLVSRGREDFLAVVLSSLLSQDYLHPIRLHLIHHQDNIPQTYLLNQMRHLLKATRKIELVESQADPKRSLANVRAQCIEMHCNSEWVLMLDNDSWFPPYAISQLWMASILYREINAIAIGLPHVDVTNERGYHDFSHYTYRDLEDYKEKWNNHTGSNFHMFARDIEVDYSTTHALWHRQRLLDSGVLDFWLRYPEGERFYDYEGSKLAVEKGYKCLLLNSETLKGVRGAFWHLWTVKSDKGYFDKKGLF